ncbi:MAG: hypothetical protein HC858_06240 [Brachymonas sp.]|nr:hypothetical protein [Brachymonas sp.]
MHDEQLLRDALGAKLWRSVLRQLFLPVSKDIALRRADFLDLSESRLVLFFLHQDHAADSGQVPSHVRAAQAVQAMLRAGVQAKAWLAHNLPDQPAGQVPMLRLLTSLHKGPIDVIRVPLDFGGERDKVVGPTAQFMHQLRDGEPRVMWRVLGTQAAVAASSNTYKLGAQMDISVGAQEVRVHALQAMNPAFNAGEALDASAWI